MTRFLKTVHGWLGVMILPWVILAGLTGLYQNHGNLFLRVLPQTRILPALIADLPSAPVDLAAVQALATTDLGRHVLAREARVLGRPGFQAVAPDLTLQVDAATGARLWIGAYVSTLTDADGHVLARQVQWSRLLQRLHRAGWAGDRFGTWPADLAAGALVVFGSSGLWLFLAPRVRRWKNRRARG